MPDRSVELRLILSGIFSMDDLLEKCSAAHYLLSQCARRGLRAKERFWGFARKFQSLITGKTAVLGICP